MGKKKVYMVDAGGYTKIGISKVPSRRFKEIKSHVPFEAELVGVIKSDDASSLERRIHDEYSEYRANGQNEWFELPEHIHDPLSSCERIDMKDMDIIFGGKIDPDDPFRDIGIMNGCNVE